MVKLIDVHPSGEAYNIAEGILKVKSSGATTCEVDMLGTANVFLEGHSIRVDITNSNFPQFARAEHAATNAVQWGGSRIVLPVVALPTGGA